MIEVGLLIEKRGKRKPVDPIKEMFKAFLISKYKKNNAMRKLKRELEDRVNKLWDDKKLGNLDKKQFLKCKVGGIFERMIEKKWLKKISKTKAHLECDSADKSFKEELQTLFPDDFEKIISLIEAEEKKSNKYKLSESQIRRIVNPSIKK